MNTNNYSVFYGIQLTKLKLADIMKLKYSFMLFLKLSFRFTFYFLKRKESND